MSILKIRDGDDFVSIPALVGPQGPRGEKGETGLQGLNGRDGTNIEVSNTQPVDENVEVWINPSATSDINDLQNQIDVLQQTINKLSRRDACYLYNSSGSSDNTAYTINSGDANTIGWNAYYTIGNGFVVSDSVGTVTINSDKIKTVKVSGNFEWVKDWLLQLKIIFCDANDNQLSAHYGCIQTGNSGMNHVSIPEGIFVNCQKGYKIKIKFYSATAGGSINIRDRRHIYIEAIEYYD